eukprot:TRINITY_DN9700_c0_g1_i1.p1 TRINITY_DN9700_c0_g1~~TRINITY_DN9700_c0_g1_i1.p1  ORF type:complete len:276 (+),score=32.07 TRINITY_DN9700_c0_g1_i1:99-926(+)
MWKCLCAEQCPANEDLGTEITEEQDANSNPLAGFEAIPVLTPQPEVFVKALGRTSSHGDSELSKENTAQVIWNEASELQPFRFDVILNRACLSETCRLGIDIDLVDPEIAVVSNIPPDGLVSHWNQVCQPAEVVKPHDRLKLVGRLPGSGADLVQRIKQAPLEKPLVLTFERPVESTHVVIPHPGETGVEVSFSGVSQSLMIESISYGTIGSWNRSHPCDPVMTKDRIISVNGVSGSAAVLEQQFQRAKFAGIELKILRYRQRYTPRQEQEIHRS